MTNEILQNALAEEAEILTKLRVVQALIHGYSDKPAVRHNSQNGRTIEFVSEYLRNSSGPVSTHTLLDELARHGINIGGKVPHANLSATLSRSDRFCCVGKRGWILR